MFDLRWLSDPCAPSSSSEVLFPCWHSQGHFITGPAVQGLPPVGPPPNLGLDLSSCQGAASPESVGPSRVLIFSVPDGVTRGSAVLLGCVGGTVLCTLSRWGWKGCPGCLESGATVAASGRAPVVVVVAAWWCLETRPPVSVLLALTCGVAFHFRSHHVCSVHYHKIHSLI